MVALKYLFKEKCMMRKMVTLASLVVIVFALVLFVGIQSAQADKSCSTAKNATDAKCAAKDANSCPKSKAPNSCPKSKHHKSWSKAKDPNCSSKK